MLEELKDSIIGYCRDGDRTEDTLHGIVSVTESLSLEDRIGVAKALILIEDTASILLESYKSVNMDDATLESQIDIVSSIKENMDIVNYPNDTHYTLVSEALSHLNEVAQIRNTDQYIYNKSVDVFEKVLGDMDKIIVLEGSNVEWTDAIVFETAIARTQAEFDLEFIHFMMGPEDIDFLTERASEIVRLSNRHSRLIAEEYDIVNESSIEDHHTEVTKGGKVSSSKSGIKDAAIKADTTSRKTANGIRKSASDAKRIGVIASKSGGRFANLMGNTLGKLDKMNKEQRVEAILSGGMRRRVSNLLRNAAVVGTATAINPLLGLITLLTTAAIRRSSDKRLVREIEADYEGELKMVKEKLRDAESAGDRKKKYELMRIETHLEQNIERLQNPGIRNNKPRLKRG